MKFVLITVLLQLCLSVLDVNAGGGAGAGAAFVPPGDEVDENQLQFGDLLAFSDETLSHYAVYVGEKHFEGKQPGQNIFEMTRNPPGCHFSQKQGPFRRHNYLDPGIAPQGKSLQPQTMQKMIETIERLRKKLLCKTYNLLSWNCEQIATTVRYGKANCKQEGTYCEKWAKCVVSPPLKRREASAAA